MKLTILGGGGFRVPLVYGALLADHAEGRVTDGKGRLLAHGTTTCLIFQS